MIYCLTGKIVKKSMNAVVLSCGGVGYYAQCPASVAGALPGVGKETTLYTVMSVTENDVSLYGFDLFCVLVIYIYQLFTNSRHFLEIFRHGKVTHVLPPYIYAIAAVSGFCQSLTAA